MMESTGLLARLEQSDADPTAVAMVESSGAVATRQEIVARARAVARGLVRAGLEPGDRVLFAVRPGIDTIVWMVGIAESGGVLVAADLGVGDTLFASQMALIRPRWVVADTFLLAASRSALLRRIARMRGVSLLPLRNLRDARCIRVGRALPGVGQAIAGTRIELDGLHAGTIRMPVMAAEAPLAVVFTSGTTAAPKGVMHSVRSIAATLDIVGSRLGFSGGDVLYASDVHLILPALSAGVTVVVPSRGKFSPARMQHALRTHGVSHFFIVTADAQVLADYLVKHGEMLPDSVREVMIGAAPVRASFLRRFQSALPPGARAWCVFGMTELLPAAFITLEDKLAYAGDGDMLGEPARGVGARLTGEGELVLRGPNLFSGYVGSEPVAEHYTGDLARIDDGRIVLLGRCKDMIIRGRHNIYPELHEPVVERVPGVKRCAMIGVFDERLADERIVLVVEPEDGVDGACLLRDVSRALREGASRIDAAAAPDLILVLPLPMSGRSRKVDKQALRALARIRLEESSTC